MTLLKQFKIMPSSNRKPTDCWDADCIKAYNKFVKKNKAAVLNKSECVNAPSEQHRIYYYDEKERKKLEELEKANHTKKMKKKLKKKLKKKEFRVKTHRMWFYGTSDLIKMAEDHENYTVSHLCHTNRCMNPAHLVLESLAVNKSRNVCPAGDKCFHGPPCLKAGHQVSSLSIAVWDKDLSVMVKK